MSKTGDGLFQQLLKSKNEIQNDADALRSIISKYQNINTAYTI